MESPVGKSVKFKYVSKYSIPKLLEMDVERAEIFMGENGELYLVSKGDLDVYHLRQGKDTEFLEGHTLKEKIDENMFLSGGEIEGFDFI